MLPRLKVCCIASAGEARMALDHGAWALGLVGAMPSGPGAIADERIAEIARSVPREVPVFLLTSRTDGAHVVAHLEETGANTVQLVDAVPIATYAAIRRALPGVRIVQVIHVCAEPSVEEARAAAEHADMLLLDSGDPKLPVKELGGTGRTHDWALSRAIVDSVDVPVLLAGGIRPGNVREAIGTVRPFGVDVCSGLRTEGRLDREKLSSLIAAMRPSA